MQPLEALNVLEKVTSTFKGTREEHGVIAGALNTLNKFIRENTPDREAVAEDQEEDK